MNIYKKERNGHVFIEREREKLKEKKKKRVWGVELKLGVLEWTYFKETMQKQSSIFS